MKLVCLSTSFLAQHNVVRLNCRNLTAKDCAKSLKIDFISPDLGLAKGPKEAPILPMGTCRKAPSLPVTF